MIRLYSTQQTSIPAVLLLASSTGISSTHAIALAQRCVMVALAVLQLAQSIDCLRYRTMCRRHHISRPRKAVQNCHWSFGPGKIGPGGPFLPWKFWSGGPKLPVKMVRHWK